MKKNIIVTVLFFLYCIVTHHVSAAEQPSNLLAVVIMVKNEANVVIPTLKPFIDAGLQSFLFFDTGSTDGTQDIARHYFEESGVTNAHIIEEPFIDFSTSRNRALDLADQLFADHTFLLMLDAEWYTHDVATILDYCKQNEHYIAPGCTGSCYLMRLFTIKDSINNYVIRLMRVGHNVRYIGPVHETITAQPSGMVPHSAYFEYAPQEEGQAKSDARLLRDYALLKKSHENDPTNTRTLFYLGQTCQFLHAWKEAIFYYKKRLELGPLSEEQYLAAYRIGYAIEYYMEESKDSLQDVEYSWDDAFRYYLLAHNMLPLRAEPLFRIACYYIRNNQHAIAYLFAMRAAQLPYPQTHSLFVESKIYDYFRYDILGQCALYAADYEMGRAAILQALKIAPDNPALHYNLALYNQYLIA